MQLILSNELHLKVTIPNTVKSVNFCYLIITSHTVKMEAEGVRYPEIGLLSMFLNFDKNSGLCSYKIGSYPIIKNYWIDIPIVIDT